jgi:hypothetical protein
MEGKVKEEDRNRQYCFGSRDVNGVADDLGIPVLF